jgi:hydrogenase maturation protease
MTPRKTLIAGFGNVLLGDDGFGVEVIKRLAVSDLPPHIEALDVGIAGMHFVLQLIEGFDAVILVDAVKRGQPPGTLYVFTPSEADLDLHSGERIDPHFAEPLRALKLARALGVASRACDNCGMRTLELSAGHVSQRLREGRGRRRGGDDSQHAGRRRPSHRRIKWP